MLFIGVDPGKSGGLFVLTEDRQFHSAVPNLTPEGLLSWIAEHKSPKQPIHVFIEKAQCMPKQGIVSAFTYGTGFGELLGVFKASRMPFNLVPPQLWIKEMIKGLPSHLSGKDRNVAAARQLFPDFNLLASSRSSTPHLGLVDSLLLAEYGRRLVLSNKYISEDKYLEE